MESPASNVQSVNPLKTTTHILPRSHSQTLHSPDRNSQGTSSRLGFNLAGVRAIAATISVASLAIIGGIANIASAQELVRNGGFEQPVLHDSQYEYLSAIPGWTHDPTSVSSLFEIRLPHPGEHSGFEGAQFTELNSVDTTSLYQDLVTAPGALYTLSFAYSPRPQYKQNIMRVWWDGNLVDTVTANGLGISDSVWSLHQYTVAATGTSTRLTFDDLLETNVLPGGSYLDAVSVTAVPEPSSILLLMIESGAILLLLRRRVSAS